MRLLAAIALIAAVLHHEPVTTIYIAGDSTAAPKLAEKRPETGWGERLQQHLDAARVLVDNRARNGRSTRTFIAEGHWQAIVDSLRSGDVVIVQFGHNDASVDKTDRYTPPDAYRANLVRFTRDVRARGATPVLATPVARRRFDPQGRVRLSHGVYPDIVRAVAAEQGVPLLELEHATVALLERYGADSSRALFLQLRAGEHVNYPAGIEDNTHFSPRGADEVASLAIAALRRSALPALAALLPPR